MNKKKVDIPVRASDRETLMMGMEAIGDLLMVAASNEHQSLQPLTVAKVGDLFRFMAMEVQRLQEAA